MHVIRATYTRYGDEHITVRSLFETNKLIYKKINIKIILYTETIILTRKRPRLYVPFSSSQYSEPREAMNKAAAAMPRNVLRTKNNCWGAISFFFFLGFGFNGFGCLSLMVKVNDKSQVKETRRQSEYTRQCNKGDGETTDDTSLRDKGDKRGCLVVVL